MTYNVDYFINKFEAIPEDKWFVGSYQNPNNPEQKCARGHCGGDYSWLSTEEEMALLKLLGRFTTTSINDGIDLNYQQPTPKQRILAALYDLKRQTNDIKKDKI